MLVYKKEHSKADIKNDNNPVIKADLETNRILTDGLKKLCPKLSTVRK